MNKYYNIVRPGSNSGCQTLYEITPKNGATVGDFVKEAISEKSEWGYVVAKREHCTKELARIEYENGKIIKNCDPNILTEKVIKGTMETGWTRTDFTLIVPRNEYYTNKELLEMLDKVSKDVRLNLTNESVFIKNEDEKEGHYKAMRSALGIIQKHIEKLEE